VVTQVAELAAGNDLHRGSENEAPARRRHLSDERLIGGEHRAAERVPSIFFDSVVITGLS
jgi:hypothetical protein